jgi:phosphoglycolate phosphatase
MPITYAHFMNPPDKLLLWDIDGTIIGTKGAGETAMNRAFKEVFNLDADLYAIDYSGRTDPLLGRMLCEYYGVSDSPTTNQAFVDAYVRNLSEILSETPATLLPGMGVLEILAQRTDCLQGLLTGNVRSGGKVKLESVDAWQYFKFGSFADNCFNRNELAPKALEIALDDFGLAFTQEQIFVFGDTPRDVECGQQIQAQTIAVATGKYSLGELAESEPDFLFEDFFDTEAFLAILD